MLHDTEKLRAHLHQYDFLKAHCKGLEAKLHLEKKPHLFIQVNLSFHKIL